MEEGAGSVVVVVKGEKTVLVSVSVVEVRKRRLSPSPRQRLGTRVACKEVFGLQFAAKT